jgi:hypothetical protein
MEASRTSSTAIVDVKLVSMSLLRCVTSLSAIGLERLQIGDNYDVNEENNES